MKGPRYTLSNLQEFEASWEKEYDYSYVWKDFVLGQLQKEF